MFTLFFRAMLLYAVMILSMRALGKHQLGEFQPYELAFTILLADIISGPIGGVNTPLLYGLLPVAAVIVLHGILTLICMKSDRMRAIISGKPAVVVSRGVINRKELNRLCLSLSDLLEGLRSAGYLDPAQQRHLPADRRYRRGQDHDIRCDLLCAVRRSLRSGSRGQILSFGLCRAEG